MTTPTYYETLGVLSDATQDEIKRSYRRLSMQHHPDQGGNEEVFKEIGIAYGVIGDPVKRADYDRDPNHAKGKLRKPSGFKRGRPKDEQVNPLYKAEVTRIEAANRAELDRLDTLYLHVRSIAESEATRLIDEARTAHLALPVDTVKLTELAELTRDLTLLTIEETFEKRTDKLAKRVGKGELSEDEAMRKLHKQVQIRRSTHDEAERVFKEAVSSAQDAQQSADQALQDEEARINKERDDKISEAERERNAGRQKAADARTQALLAAEALRVPAP